jgi:hypothetical protein
MESNPYIEFREVPDRTGEDEDIQVYFLGVHVHTIKNTYTRPGGHVYVEKEQCVKRAEESVRRLWDLAEGTK